MVDTPAQNTLDEAHLAELEASGITQTQAGRHGVYTARTLEELPDDIQWIVDAHGDAVLPALVYPMTEIDGSETCQAKPQPDTVKNKDGHVLKYVSPAKNRAPEMPVVRWDEKRERVLIVEGVKQALVVDAHADDSWNVVRICGVSSWTRGGVPSQHFAPIVQGREVVVIVDADAQTNRQVYDGAELLGKASSTFGATSVAFVRVQGFGSSGIDDLLASAPEAARADALARMISQAKPKPADTKPKPAAKKQENRAEDLEESERIDAELKKTGRQRLHVHDDPQDVIVGIRTALERRYEDRVFNHGGKLGFRVTDRDRSEMISLDSGEFKNLIAAAIYQVEGQDQDDETLEDGRILCKHQPMWAPAITIEAALSDYRNYRPLDSIVRTPLVSEDGSVTTEPGYDSETRTYLELSEDIRGIRVPEHPTDSQLEDAVAVLDDVLADFPFKDKSDRAHAFAMLVTPLVRAMLPTSPIFIINGVDKGTGKGLLATVSSMIATGRSPEWTLIPQHEEEFRKRVTSLLVSGASAIYLDEAHEIGGDAINALATAETWGDRELGKTRMLNLPNKATIVSTGNNVAIMGDTVRRVVQIRLHTDDPNPQDRTNFRHPDLKAHIAAHRRELLSAVLTLVTAWFDRGKPSPTKAFSFGSFERWQEVVGGVLQLAGIDGFLEGLQTQREEVDYARQEWKAHLHWLHTVFGDVPFTASEANQKMRSDGDAVAPHGHEELTDKSSPRTLGRAYGKVRGRWFDDIRIVEESKKQNKTYWQLQRYVRQGVPSPDPDPEPPAPAPALPIPTQSSDDFWSQNGSGVEINELKAA